MGWCLSLRNKFFYLVMLSAARANPAQRESEGESKHPENVSSVMSRQEILPSLCPFISIPSVSKRL